MFLQDKSVFKLRVIISRIQDLQLFGNTNLPPGVDEASAKAQDVPQMADNHLPLCLAHEEQGQNKVLCSWPTLPRDKALLGTVCSRPGWMVMDSHCHERKA